MKNKKLITGLLLTLFMIPSCSGNTIGIEQYNDYSISNVDFICEFKATSGERAKYLYELDISNTGTGYIFLGQSTFSYLEAYWAYGYSFNLGLSPNETGSLLFASSEKDLTADKIKTGSVVAGVKKENLLNDVITVNKVLDVYKTGITTYGELDGEEVTYTTYTYEVYLDYEVKNQNFSVALYEIEIDGYSVNVFSGVLGAFAFSTPAELTASNITVKKVYGVPGSTNSSSNVFMITGAVLAGLVLLMILAFITTSGFVKNKKIRKKNVKPANNVNYTQHSDTIDADQIEKNEDSKTEDNNDSEKKEK